MADPLSITASVIAIGTLATQVCETLVSLRVRTDFKGRLHTIKSEISDLQTVLNHASSVLDERSKQKLSNDALEAVSSILRRIQVNLKQQDRIACRLAKPSDSTKGKIIASGLWLKEKPKLQQLREELRSLKASLVMCFGASNTEDATRIRLDLRRISILTQDSSDERLYFHAVTRKLADQQNLVHQTLFEHQNHMDDRFDKLEGLWLQQMAMLQFYNEHAEPGPGTSHDSKGLFPGLQIQAAQYNGPVCKSWCPCACHSRKKLKTPKMLDRFLGELFVGYAGLPFMSRPCNKRYCERKQAPFVSVDYWFPSWWTSHIVKMTMIYQPLSGPQMSLSTLRRVQEASVCFDLAGKGDIEGVKALLIAQMTSVKDVGAKTGYTMLTCAVIKRQSRMASFLLSIGSDPHHDPSGIQPTPSDLAWDLWLRGVVPSTEELFIRPLLHHSDFVEEQNFPLVHRIVLGLSFKDLDHELLANPDAVFAVDTQGRTALSWAACRGDALSCAKLIKSGADANTLDKHGKSPLYLAVNSEHKTQNAVVRVLLAGGAETDQKLFNAGVIRSTPLLCSANEATDILVLKSLLDFGAKLEAKNRAGATPLIIVARSKPVTFTALLLAYGANLHAKDNDGNTVLTTAIKYNNHDVLRLLLDRWFRYTACPRARNMDILHAAAESADLETMGILVIAGAWGLRGDGADKRGQTAREIFEKRKNKTPELELIFRKLLRAIRATKTDVDEVRLLEAGLLQEWSWPSRRKSSLQEDLKLFEIAGKHGMLIAVDEMAVEDDDDTEDDADEKFEEAVEHLVQV